MREFRGLWTEALAQEPLENLDSDGLNRSVEIAREGRA